MWDINENGHFRKRDRQKTLHTENVRTMSLQRLAYTDRKMSHNIYRHISISSNFSYSVHV